MRRDWRLIAGIILLLPAIGLSCFGIGLFLAEVPIWITALLAAMFIGMALIICWDLDRFNNK